MGIVAIGGEADCFEYVSGQAFAHDATAGRFEANISRVAMQVVQGTSELEWYWNSSETSFWMHVYLWQETVDTMEEDYIVFRTATGDPCFRIVMESDGTWSIQKYASSAWSSDLDTSDSPVLMSAAGAIDVNIVIDGSSGVFDVYKDGVKIIEFAGDTSIDESDVGSVYFGGTGDEITCISQGIVDDATSTIGKKLVTLAPTGNGTHTDWVGDYADVDEASLDVDDFIASDTPDDEETFTTGSLPGAVSSYSPVAVAIGVRAMIPVLSDVDEVHGLLVVGSSDYTQGDLGFVKDGTQQSRVAIVETNPDTTNPWIAAEVNSAEFGVSAESA